MSNRSLIDEIITLVKSEANNNPSPKSCKIVGNYGDEPYSDVEIDGVGKLTYIKTIGSTKIGLDGVICFLDGDLNHGLAITSVERNIVEKFGLDQDNSDKFNFAIITKSDNYITYEEFWILSNAYYDYDVKRFVKIDGTHTSFGIQIQANGSYPGEADLGYFDNVGINIWRNPKKSDVYKDPSSFDYSDFENKNYIGAKRLDNNLWVEFGISSGWSNSFMIDSYGGMTIGGAGFEVDGNGIFPFTRLTSSAYVDSNGDDYYLLGLLDNAYHPTLYGWDCDSNKTYSWFVGLKTPEISYLLKDNALTKFVVMYNDTPYDSENIHYIDKSRWKTVFEVDVNSVNGLINGELKELGDYDSLKNKPTIPSNLSDLNNDMGFLTSHQDLSDYVTSSNLLTVLGDYVTNSNLLAALSDYIASADLTNILSGYITNSDLLTTLSDYVSNTTLSSILNDYITSSGLSAILNDYVTNSSLLTALSDYVSSTSLSNILSDYVTNSSLLSSLSDYVSSTSLSSILSDYVTSADANANYAPIIHTHDGLADSGWVDLTLTGNFYNFDNSNRVQYRKVGKTVQITGLPVLNAYPSALMELAIGTLPSGYRPSRDVSFVCELKDDAKLWTCTIKSTGDVTFNRLRDNTGFVAGTAFADVLKLNVTFLA